MRDRVSPVRELLEEALARPVSRRGETQVFPDHSVESLEVMADVRRIWISVIELPPGHEMRADRGLRSDGLERARKTVYRLRVQIPAVALKLGGQQDRVRLIDLPCRIAAPSSSAADRDVSALDLVERRCSVAGPSVV